MIMETILSRSLRMMFSGGIVISIGLLTQPVFAQQITDEQVQRVEITGSSIKRLASEAALPVTVLQAADFVKQGLTTTEQVLNSLSTNQTVQGGSQSVGASTGGQSQADLRGIGANKTLVLLNGRRLANHPYDGATVDLNIIPMAALDRVEVLRDGASAIYGTDAIGGVINFITKRSVKGIELTGEGVSPKQSGGSEGRINLLGGFGDLDKDGFNIFGVIDYHKQKAVEATQRDFSKSGIIPSIGLNKTSGNTPISNYFDNGSNAVGNPSFASGCDPAGHSFPQASDGTCRYDFSSQVDDIPETEQVSLLTKGSLKLNSEHTATFEYLHSYSSNINRVAAAPFYDGEDAALTGLQVPINSPFYPNIPGLTGPLSINWRPLEVGKRTEKDISKTDRLLLALEGTIAGWDYKTGFIYARSQASNTLTNGYIGDRFIFEGVTGTSQVLTNGQPTFDPITGLPDVTPLPGGPILNPFGPQTAAGTQYLNNNQLKGVLLSGKTTTTGVDFKASREFGELAGGAMGMAFGAEFHHDVANYDVNYAVATQAASTGSADAKSIAGDRNVGAIFGEFLAPLTKQLELQLAARYDHYSDVGSTFNPKVGFRYQPAKVLMFRGSYNTGFRAPSLYEKNQPNQITNSADNYDDPLLCPGGTAIPNANPNVVCNAQQNLRSGGNQALSPEKSKSYTLGFVVEPTQALTVSLDYWNIQVKDVIGVLPEATLFSDPRFSNQFVYNAANTALLYVNDTNQNLGEIRATGEDLNVTWRLPKTSIGQFLTTYSGTYVNGYEYQNYRNGPFIQNVGTFTDTNPVFRWKHNLAVQWSSGDWSATVSQLYMSGYHDQNDVDPEFFRDVKSYSVWGISGTYTGIKNLSITAGIKNLMDTNPPVTNQGVTFQQGYDPRFADPIGRAYFLRGTYRFM